jgi:hypothetical protein
MGIVEQGGKRNARPEQAAVLALAPALFLVVASLPCLLEVVLRPTARPVFLRVQHGQMLAYRIFGGIALHFFRRPGPDSNDPVRIHEEYGHFLDFNCHQPLQLGYRVRR